MVGSAWVENPHRHKQASMAYIKAQERNGSTIPVTGEAKCWKGASELSARTRLNLFCGFSSCTNRSSCSCFSQRRLRMYTRTPEATTTPIDPRVADMMIPYLREQFGNPASRSQASNSGARLRPSTSRT